MAQEIVRALRTRKPAPKFELASGRIVQTEYLGAAGTERFRAWQANVQNLELFFEVVGLIVPELTRKEIEAELSLEDCGTLIGIGRGNVPAIEDAIKNGGSGGESPAPPPTPASPPTTT